MTGARHRWTIFDAGDAAQRADRRGRRQARARARRRHGADSGVPRRDGVLRPAHDILGHRHGRSRARGEPARPADRSASRRRTRARWPCRSQVQADLLEAAAIVPVGRERDRRAARRPRGCGCGSTAPTCRRSISTAAARRSRATSSSCAIRRDCAPSGRRSRCRALPRAGAADRKRRSGDPSPRPRTAVRGAASTRDARRAADALRQRPARKEADGQPAVGARGAAHQGRRLQRAHGALRRDGARGRHSRAHRGRPRVRARRVLLPRVARGVHRRRRRPRGLWLPVDPTLNQFPADATHVRLARGGLDKQTAILPLIGRLKMTILDVEAGAGLARRFWPARRADLGQLAIPLPQRDVACCACSPMIAIHDLVKTYGRSPPSTASAST